jgi:hypothetical protein
MNKTNLKRYAPQARKDFIAAVMARAQLLGLTEVGGQPYAEPCQVNGDVAVIAGRPWPASVQGKRDRLLQRMKRDGYAATLEAVAYTWFNRFAALRYMELHDYLGHGRRVLSNPDGALPEVLSHAVELAEAGDLPGLQVEQVRQLKLDNQDGELFRRVLIAQCNALHGAMPFLFEAIDDETELLLPENLLLSDSVVAKLVSEIPEEDWVEVEAIGWLYQFYISEKKDQVIGKVVKSEDIPAATQLFTPNWIVQYLVQNSVGRLWLMANPASTLVSQWPYYISPAEQTPEVQTQLDALIQTRIREDGGALNPETITVLDPACGSGHILVVAYDVLKAMYLERGYQPRAIPRLILEKNLYGLDIDDRAAQLAGFALLMKARADDRRLFNNPPKLNVLSFQESKGLDAKELITHLAVFGLRETSIEVLLDTFKDAKTFGSLIHIPDSLNRDLTEMKSGLENALINGDLYAHHAANSVLTLILQSLILGLRFDSVIANPPYMGNRGYSSELKSFLAAHYHDAKENIFAAFIDQSLNLVSPSGVASLVTMHNWMFLNRFQAFRREIVKRRTIESLIHHGAGAFEEISGEVVQTACFALRPSRIESYSATYVSALGYSGDQKSSCLSIESQKYIGVKQSAFEKISGEPVAYWLTEKFSDIFKFSEMGDVCEPREGLTTGNNAKHVRQWYELDIRQIGFGVASRESGKICGAKWFPYNKGGEYRKWYGNIDSVVNWEDDGYELQSALHPSGGRIWAHNFNLDFIFKPAVTWTDITSTGLAARYMPAGCLFDATGLSAFYQSEEDLWYCLAASNSIVASRCAPVLNPTLHFKAGDFKRLPLPSIRDRSVIDIAKKAVDVAKQDWDEKETSWGFAQLDLLSCQQFMEISCSWLRAAEQKTNRINLLRGLEEKSNSIFIESYGLQDEITPEVSEEQIALTRGDREKDCQRLISYAIGCLLGRYSLDEPGLMYAHAGNIGFDSSRYEKKFPADADGIVPTTVERWFEDDAASRVREFLRAAWGPDKLEENIAWLAESLGTKGTEAPDESIRRYLADKFFKDHLQTYKKRPIYWLFSSGKQGAFQALVYLHRYHEGTLARMRSEYVLPLTGKMQARMEGLEVDIRQASSTAARNRLTKQLDALRKQHHELLAYDEKLRHYADQRIAIDLDDGVKVNYGKFGDLLAEVKAVTGGAGDE